MSTAVVIPARFASERFPGKVLAPVGGVALVVRVARAVCSSRLAARVVVATDDTRVVDSLSAQVETSNLSVWYSERGFCCGTDRVAAAAAALDLNHEFIVNVQVDEVSVNRQVLESAIAALRANPEAAMGTVATPISQVSQLSDPSVVKVDIDAAARAGGFRRLAIVAHWAHVGVYAFTPGGLRRFAALPPSRSERLHRLEQLRVVDSGLAVAVGVVYGPHRAINTRQDLLDWQAMCLKHRDPQLVPLPQPTTMEC